MLGTGERDLSCFVCFLCLLHFCLLHFCVARSVTICCTFACYASACTVYTFACYNATLFIFIVCYTSVDLVHYCLLQFFSASLLHLHENLTWVGPIDTHVFIWYFKLNLKQNLLLVNTNSAELK